MEKKEQEYVSLSESVEHISRHFAGSETVGSKFFADSKDAVVGRVEEELMKSFF